MLEATAHWLSDLPTTLAVIVSLLVGAGLSALGLLVVHPIVPHGVRAVHNDVSGFIFATVGVTYAVLLAFVAVAVWQNFAQIESQVQMEANLVGNLYRDTVAFPEPAASRLRHFLFVYAEIVVQDEWPALAAGRADEAPGWQLMDKFQTELLQFQANDESVGVLRADAIKTLNELYNARRGRFQAATSELPPILWWNLIAGAVILMMFTYLFGVPRLWMHLATVSLLGALIGLIMALVVLLNNPFRGQNHVSIAPFHRLVKSVETMAYPHD
jgi:ABC-type multidrug transport system fused ATPase/permease subunit